MVEKELDTAIDPMPEHIDESLYCWDLAMIYHANNASEALLNKLFKFTEPALFSPIFYYMK